MHITKNGRPWLIGFSWICHIFGSLLVRALHTSCTLLPCLNSGLFYGAVCYDIHNDKLTTETLSTVFIYPALLTPAYYLPCPAGLGKVKLVSRATQETRPGPPASSPLDRRQHQPCNVRRYYS